MKLPNVHGNVAAQDLTCACATADRLHHAGEPELLHKADLGYRMLKLSAVTTDLVCPLGVFNIWCSSLSILRRVVFVLLSYSGSKGFKGITSVELRHAGTTYTGQVELVRKAAHDACSWFCHNKQFIFFSCVGDKLPTAGLWHHVRGFSGLACRHAVQRHCI